MKYMSVFESSFYNFWKAIFDKLFLNEILNCF